MARIRLNESSSRTVTFTLKDNAGAAVPLSAINTAQLTLYDVETRTVINSRNAQNVKNAHNVTIDEASGLVTWAMQPEDNAIITERRQVERHRAEFRFVAGDVELDCDPIDFEVVNLRKES